MPHPAPSHSDNSQRLPTGAFATLLALYLAQGLPSGLFAHALPVFWREAGVSLAWIGALKLLALPWVLKALWAPLVDRSLARGTKPGRWVLGLQLSAAGLLAILGFTGLVPETNTALLWAILMILAINLLMATQDIITDGLAIKWLHAHWRGFANTLQVAGYKLGMLAGGALLLMLSAHIDTRYGLLILSLGLVGLLLLIHRSRLLQQPAGPESTPELNSNENPPSLWEGFSGLVRQPGMGFWLAMVASYKIADALGSGMIRPMLTDSGWSSQAIGSFTLITTLVGLAGAALGGWLYTRIGGRRSLIGTGIVQAVTISAWALVDLKGADTGLVYSVGLAEQLADGASTVVLFAMMMNVCRTTWAGTDFTLQASIQVVFAGLFGLAGGVIANLTGYTPLLLMAGMAGLLIILIYTLKTRATARIPLS